MCSQISWILRSKTGILALETTGSVRNQLQGGCEWFYKPFAILCTLPELHNLFFYISLTVNFYNSLFKTPTKRTSLSILLCIYGPPEDGLI
jgi:hypothetical protein